MVAFTVRGWRRIYVASIEYLTERRIRDNALSEASGELCLFVPPAVDASPPDMWDLRGWTKLPQNRNLRHPAVLTSHLMRHLYRDPKFIVLVREPVER